MRIDGINPQAGALSEDFMPVHLAALATGHHFAHRCWFAVRTAAKLSTTVLLVAASALDYVALPLARNEALLDRRSANMNALHVQYLPSAISQPIVLVERQRR
ncbi:hypothetical protein O3297_19205 [Janthinobacterium sp. SUN128]|uniref:hypothetical protein n=1 Tax=Janthinobacterium sp. SUN128 TaxID=3014790 RepID=UPI002712DE89|nr:hypothetical protein [Janthinobacterium sp. SUN128]MDO8035549.1 hypothetical protein [Janthinobacterium sp. SUN128]